MTVTRVPGLPFALQESEPWPWRTTPTGVEVTAKPRSDLFVDPSGQGGIAAQSLMNAVTLLGTPPAGDFTLTARVQVQFTQTFDAGVLLIWADERHWAKLCFEYSPQGEAMVVSVVTRELSDDANGFLVPADHVWLRIARIDDVWAFHASTDGKVFSFIRAFNLGVSAPQIGFEAQSPNGQECDVRFSDVAFTATRLSDLRDGS